MKKIIFRIIMMILALILIFSGIILYSEKVHTLAFVEDIKKALGELNQVGSYSVTNETKIDVTDLVDNGNIGHEHTFKTMYDENKHWEECTVCGQKNNEVVHSYKTTWASGSESCNQNNYYTNTCICGYSYIGHKPCVWNGKNYAYAGYRHYKRCSVCGTFCYNGYYYNGKLSYEPGSEECTDRYGNIITCNTGGTCTACGQVTIKGEHSLVADNNVLNCSTCGNNYGTYSRDIIQLSNAPASYKIVITYNLVGATYNGIQTYNDSPTVFKSVSRSVIDKVSDTQFKVQTILNYQDTFKVTDNPMRYFHTYVNIGNQVRTVSEIMGSLRTDVEEPVISSITMGNGETELTEWSKTKPIIISGTENYCDTVSVNIVDENGEKVFEGEGNVVGNNFSISCVPYIEVDTNGKTFTAILKDACDNEIRKEFTISKVDSIPPTATSSDDLTGEWAKSRKFKFTATDYGKGEVSIAFNDVADLNLANFNGTEYSRDYEFYGDVYKPKQLSVLYRDGLGNTSMQKVTIDKLDNTAPTIESASIHNNVITVNAHDMHERLGEGSGIVKYRYISSSKKLSNPDVSTGIEVNVDDKMVIDNVYQAKYIYIVAEDIVGNVSDVYEVKVPELVLTSSVDLSLANGKGGVILDWSTYDVSDKYFVVYRKEGNSTDWETIVSLDEKLTESTYTDILGNDKAKPDVPNINITGDAQNNNIKIEATSNDNGTKYSYYIEAYDDNGTLLQISI